MSELSEILGKLQAVEYVTGEIAISGLEEAEQSIEAYYTKRFEAAIDFSVYEVTEAPSLDYEKGYNDMVLATRLMLAEARTRWNDD